MRRLLILAPLLLTACNHPPARLVTPPVTRLVETPRPAVPETMTDESTAQLIADYDAALGACNADKGWYRAWFSEAGR